MSSATLLRPVSGPAALRRWAVALLVANVVIIVTGALVRLTGSGLGCPTWPRCTSDSFVSHPALGIHGAIEFGNRLLTFVLIVVAVLTVLTAIRNGRGVRALALVLLAGIPLQGVIGGISVLTRLNPLVVGLHLLASLALVVLAVRLVRRTRRLGAAPVAPATAALVRVTFAVAAVAATVGTVVTGSGPHAGDADVPRTGFDPVLVTHLHAAVVYALVAGAIGCVVVLRSRPAVWLVLVLVFQAAVGFAQYYSGLPVPLVLLHLLGAALTLAAAANLLFSVTVRTPAGTGTEPRPLARAGTG